VVHPSKTIAYAARRNSGSKVTEGDRRPFFNCPETLKDKQARKKSRDQNADSPLDRDRSPHHEKTIFLKIHKVKLKNAVQVFFLSFARK